MLTISLKGSPIQHLPVIRMSNRNQKPCSFLQRFSIQIHRSILRHHPLNIGSGSNHPSSGFQHRDNLAHPLVGSGCKRNHGFATLRHLGSTDKIQPAARAGEDTHSDRICAYLPCKVNLCG